MALKHNAKAQHMCRKLPGVKIGLVCPEHEDRCVICDGYAQMVQMARVCDDCSFGPQNDGKCIVCGSNKAEQPAYYCSYCVALEKDRDGCPKVMQMSQHKRDAHHRHSVTLQ